MLVFLCKYATIQTKVFIIIHVDIESDLRLIVLICIRKSLITSRDGGSGGHASGFRVAKRLDIPFYDHEIVDKAVAESGFTKEFVEEHGEYSSLSSVLLGTSAPFDSYYYAEDPQDKIFKIQRRIITKFAQEGPCVIVGRCANYILEQADIDSFDVFIRANIEKRMANVSDRVDLKGDELVKFLQKRDHKRRVYYRFYTKRKWGDYHDYNMMLDSGVIGKENCINLIIKAIGEQQIIIS